MKNSTKGYAFLGILFALISVIAFAVPTMKTTAFWIAYVFTVIAFAAQIAIWKVAFGRNKTMKSKFLGLPVIHIGFVYLIAQTLSLAVSLFAPMIPSWIALIAGASVSGLSAMSLIGADVGRSEIERVEAKVQKKVFYLRTIQTDVELLAETEPDETVKQSLMQLAEKIRFSDPMSHEQLMDLEAEITNKVVGLKTASSKTDVIAEINRLLAERNKKCKILK